MSLLNDYAHPCVLLEETRVPDGAGGWETTWKEGAEFQSHQVLDASLEARRAEREGVTSIYTVLVDRAVPIHYNDCFQDKATGQTYRITSDPAEKQAPKSSALPFQFFTAERRELPC